MLPSFMVTSGISADALGGMGAWVENWGAACHPEQIASAAAGGEVASAWTLKLPKDGGGHRMV